MTEFRYKAFISYSHKNDRQAAWLMKKLEAFRIPRHLSQPNWAGSKPAKLGKMFRDREELSASINMDAKISDALKNSEYLIVVCSRDSARSSRVNSEVRQFIQHRDSRKILCLIVDGEPNFDVPGIEPDDGCIPSELRKLHLVAGQVPLAADARSAGDGRMRAAQKIIAGLLGVDLDELLRRTTRRKYRQLIAVSLASFTLTLIATGLMLKANLAEEAAKEAALKAEMQTARAEDLVTFMLDDLAGIKLRQLGRVDVMDAVVDKIIAHYESQNEEHLSPDSLARRARSYLQLGRLYLDRDLRGPANDLIERAYSATQTLLERFPELHSALYAHTVSLYWIGTNHIFNGRYSAAERVWRERVEIGEKLGTYSNHSPGVWEHMADMNVHLGWALMEMGRPEEALAQFKIGLEKRQANADRWPEGMRWQNSLGGVYYHLQWAQQYLGMLDEAHENMKRSNKFYQQIAEADPTDQRALSNYARSLRWLAQTEGLLGRYDDAIGHLKKSLALHVQLLSYERENLTVEYQACVSMVVLAEVYWLQSNRFAAESVIGNNCPGAKRTLSLDHFKIHQRFYGYRLALLQLEMALSAGDRDRAAEMYRNLQNRWKQENEEVRKSPQGRHVDLSLAIQRAALNELDGSIPNAHIQLAEAVSEAENSFFGQYPVGAKLIGQARKIVLQAARVSEMAR